ncbi:MAG: DivIVA domain-containing protein [Leucobacter sp.]|jgi:DivIVA domain-containing protein
MALTPEEVVNQRFTITKFRDGYDLDQVDDFLDSIVEELRRRDQELADLQAELDRANERIAELESEAEAKGDAQGSVSEQTIVVDAKPAQPVPAAPAASAAPAVASEESGATPTAVKSSAMLQLALELHDKYIQEGEDERDRLIKKAEQTAAQLVEGAQKQRADELRRLEGERSDYAGRIKELRDFESEYRSTLSSYIQAQLRELEGSPEPAGAPKGLD